MKVKIRVLITLLFLCVLLTAGYFMLAAYYGKGFGMNTWINGVYCTGKTVEEVNSELLSQMKAPNVVMVKGKGEEAAISLEGIGLTFDYTESLRTYQKQKNPLMWGKNLMWAESQTLIPEMKFNQELLRQEWVALPFVKAEAEEEKILEIRLTQEGYQLVNQLEARLNEEKGYLCLVQALEQGTYQVDLQENGCYEDIPMTQTQKETLAFWDKLQDFQECRVIYDLGYEMIPIDSSITWRFMEQTENGMPATDEKGEIVFREEGIAEFINTLAEEYNTYGKPHEFESTRGDVITVEGGTYGRKLDVKEETAYLKEAFLAGKEEIHSPAHEKEAFCKDKNDIGDTYIEIDMTEQKMYYYQEGECLIETEVVTGNTGRRMGTPEGVNFVYHKQKNRILRGPDYASPVSFWMPVKGNIGIHDAKWRSKFGGEIYKTGGSHGCINTPYEDMKELYELVEVGTPVIMFY